MHLETTKYADYDASLPNVGQHIIGSDTEHTIAVYQAYNHTIADFAVKNQSFGEGFSLNRMSWIKPGFLWMMYRCGWATKQNQERILAIEIEKANFVEILKQATHSSFLSTYYQNNEQWRQKLQHSDVRVQWDPDHDPWGKKLERKAIQLGLKGDFLKAYSSAWITSIEDITPFVCEQREFLKSDPGKLLVIKERVIDFPVKI